MISKSSSKEFLPVSTWQSLATRHREMVREITEPMRARKSRGEKHPVLDFLHTYYSYPLGKLERWHPGPDFVLESDGSERFSEKGYRRSEHEIFLDLELLNSKVRERLEWIRNLLRLTQARPPGFACHGLHEWAMVFGEGEVRHLQSTPLRLSREEIDQVINERPLCCTHFDAYRFFAPSAKPQNRFSPELQNREEHEQPGCIHANMDLYKWAYKSSPWISSELLRETLFFAIEAREIDMRASPYDLSAFDLPPIKIETSAGRREYEKEQRSLHDRGLIFRDQLMAALAKVLDRVD